MSVCVVCADGVRMRSDLTGRVAAASVRRRLRGRAAQPTVGLRVEHFDLVAVDLVVGVEGSEAVGSAPEHKHLSADDGGRVEVPPSGRSSLEVRGQRQWEKQSNRKHKY